MTSTKVSSDAMLEVTSISVVVIQCKDLVRLLYIRVLTESVFIDIEVIINYVITWPVKVETL